MDFQQPPKPLKPMTVALFAAYLRTHSDSYAYGREIVINGEPIVNVKIVDGQVTLQTTVDYLNDHPPCKDHIPIQHRDGKRPWCNSCGLDERWSKPASMFD